MSTENINYCVIIPTFNHSGAVAGVITDVLKVTGNVIVVNDGSTDNTAEVLNGFTDIDVISYPLNRGKGHALKEGFRAACEKGFEYAVTIDSDGQHNAAEIPLFISALRDNPGSLIVGSRNLVAENMPGGNTFANNFSNFWFRLQTGINLPDTQSGFRLYPLNRIIKIRTFSGRYEYELELLVRAAWKGVSAVPVPVTVTYLPGNKRVSHFRPYADFLRITVLNTFLTIIAILYARPALMAGKLFKRRRK